jgi:hypothetical protein
MRSWPFVTIGASVSLACLISCGSTSPDTLGPESSIVIVLEPSQATMARGGAVQFIVTPKGLGAKLTGSEVDWISSDPEVISVEPTGMVRAIQPGSATVTASWHGTYAVAPVTVTDKQTGECPALSVGSAPKDVNVPDHCE